MDTSITFSGPDADRPLGGPSRSPDADAIGATPFPLDQLGGPASEHWRNALLGTFALAALREDDADALVRSATSHAVRGTGCRAICRLDGADAAPEGRTEGVIRLPLRDGDRPLGMLEVSGGTPDAGDQRFLREMADVLSHGLARIAQRDRLAQAEAHEARLATELRHRIRNLLAQIRSVARMSCVEAQRSGADAGTLIAGRIDALSAATETGLPEAGAPVGTGDFGDPVDPAALTRHLLEPWAAARVEASGALPPLPRGEATMVALLLHELLTNAIKHGALSRSGGQVRAVWTTDARVLRLEWTEIGPGIDVPTGAHPDDTGFGQAMVARAARTVGASLRRDWRPEGLALVLEMPCPGGD